MLIDTVDFLLPIDLRGVVPPAQAVNARQTTATQKEDRVAIGLLDFNGMERAPFLKNGRCDVSDLRGIFECIQQV